MPEIGFPQWSHSYPDVSKVPDRSLLRLGIREAPAAGARAQAARRRLCREGASIDPLRGSSLSQYYISSIREAGSVYRPSSASHSHWRRGVS